MRVQLRLFGWGLAVLGAPLGATSLAHTLSRAETSGCYGLLDAITPIDVVRAWSRAAAGDAVGVAVCAAVPVLLSLGGAALLVRARSIAPGLALTAAAWTGLVVASVVWLSLGC